MKARIKYWALVVAATAVTLGAMVLPLTVHIVAAGQGGCGPNCPPRD